MVIRTLAMAGLCALFASSSFAQSASSVSPSKEAPAATSPRFEAAHVDRNKRIPIPVQGGPTRAGDRYMIYAHSMQSLVSIAYSIPKTKSSAALRGWSATVTISKPKSPQGQAMPT